MNHALKLTGWAFATLVVLYAAINPEAGVLYENPGACVGLGLIGLGLAKTAGLGARQTA